MTVYECRKKKTRFRTTIKRSLITAAAGLIGHYHSHVPEWWSGVVLSQVTAIRLSDHRTATLSFFFIAFATCRALHGLLGCVDSTLFRWHTLWCVEMRFFLWLLRDFLLLIYTLFSPHWLLKTTTCAHLHTNNPSGQTSNLAQIWLLLLDLFFFFILRRDVGARQLLPAAAGLLFPSGLMILRAAASPTPLSGDLWWCVRIRLHLQTDWLTEWQTLPGWGEEVHHTQPTTTTNIDCVIRFSFPSHSKSCSVVLFNHQYC